MFCSGLDLQRPAYKMLVSGVRIELTTQLRTSKTLRLIETCKICRLTTDQLSRERQALNKYNVKGGKTQGPGLDLFIRS